ncbi:Surfeit locus protein 2 [Anabarilius grahami]|uniref:Surfeit locus protein 2 n=1 Tax=Anabarilius grahami TaxID=495550 RepID=A0A3N0Z5V1_ANAGA|nr:Surfeit locus protein 2 [Anabarilius grahami]
MEDLPEDLRAFLLKHPCFQLTDSKKIKCALNEHEFPCSLDELQHFTSGKKYKKLSAEAEFDYRQYEPHVVNSTKQLNHLFCKLTLRHINRVPQHVLRHVNGKRYRKALDQCKYNLHLVFLIKAVHGINVQHFVVVSDEECVRQGVEFVPVQLRRKKRVKEHNEAAGSERQPKRKDDGGGICALSSSGADDSDSDDSMSDLYPCQCRALLTLVALFITHKLEF